MSPRRQSSKPKESSPDSVKKRKRTSDGRSKGSRIVEQAAWEDSVRELMKQPNSLIAARLKLALSTSKVARKGRAE